MTTPLVVTADDFGLTDATNLAVLRAHRQGIVTSTSVLAVAPAAAAGLALLDDAPDLAVGVHLALVGEDPPLSPAGAIPTLVDRRGRLASSWRVLLLRLAAGRVDPDDVRRELRAQVELVGAERPLAHLDAHQHVHLWPSVAAVVVELAQAHGIPTVRVPRPSDPGSRRGRALVRLADRLAATVDDAGLARTARFRGLEEAGRWDLAGLRRALADLATHPGSVELNCHPGALEDPARSRYRWRYGWGAELEALCHPALRADVARLGLHLARTDAVGHR